VHEHICHLQVVGEDVPSKKWVIVMSMRASGLAILHSVAPALTRQLEWTISRTLGHDVFLDWSPQPAIEGTYRTEFAWKGEPASGALLTSALAGWKSVFFEVTQDPSHSQSGSRWCYTPTLGINHRMMDEFGNVLIGEDQIRSAISSSGVNALDLQHRLNTLLAAPWDAELETLRQAAESSRVVWLHRAG
jgi:Protein of unknown function (DUF3145)